MYKTCREIFEENKSCIDEIDHDVIKACIFDIEYQENFPEDMIEERTDWGELARQLENAQFAVKYLLSAIDKLTHKKTS